jgi:hypothetical protein
LGGEKNEETMKNRVGHGSTGKLKAGRERETQNKREERKEWR